MIKPIRPQVQRIPLDQARTNEAVGLSGRRLLVVRVSSLDATLAVDFNLAANGTFPLSRGVRTKGFGFDRLYFTNDAQPGEWMDLMVVGDPNDPEDDAIDFDVPPPTASADISGGQSGSGTPVEVVGEGGDPLDVNLAAQDGAVEVSGTVTALARSVVTDVGDLTDAARIFDPSEGVAITTGNADSYLGKFAEVGAADVTILAPGTGEVYMVDLYVSTQHGNTSYPCKVRIVNGSGNVVWQAATIATAPKLVAMNLIVRSGFTLKAVGNNATYKGRVEVSGVRLA